MQRFWKGGGVANLDCPYGETRNLCKIVANMGWVPPLQRGEVSSVFYVMELYKKNVFPEPKVY